MADARTVLINGLVELGASASIIGFAVSVLAGDHPLITRSRSKHAEAQAKYMNNKKKIEKEAANSNDQQVISADQHDHNPCIISYLTTPVKAMDVEVKRLPVKKTTVRKITVRKTIMSEGFDDWPENYGELFWQAYPKKNQKAKVIALLGKIRAQGELSWCDLMFGLSRYGENLPAWQAWCWPTKWLTEERWNSNPAEENQDGKRRGRSELIQTADRIVNSIQCFDEGIGGQTKICGPASAVNVRMLSNGGGE